MSHGSGEGPRRTGDLHTLLSVGIVENRGKTMPHALFSVHADNCIRIREKGKIR